MSTIAKDTLPTGNDRTCIMQWPGMAQGDDGAPITNSQYADRSFQVAGTFGGASVAIEGTNDGSNWATLTDPQGNPLTFTTAKIEMVSEATWKIRPRVIGGDGSTALTVGKAAERLLPDLVAAARADEMRKRKTQSELRRQRAAVVG